MVCLDSSLRWLAFSVGVLCLAQAFVLLSGAVQDWVR